MFYELTPIYDSRKSFYRKAFVEVEGNTAKLYSKERLEIAIWNYEKFGNNESLMELQLAEMELNEKMEEEKCIKL